MVQVYCRDLLIGIGSWCMFQHIYYKAIRAWSHYIETLKPCGFFLLRIGRQGGSDLWGTLKPDAKAQNTLPLHLFLKVRPSAKHRYCT